MIRAASHRIPIFAFLFALCAGERYTPDWKSLDTRPLPEWFGKAKFGVIVHWGLYSVPSLGQHTADSFWSNWKLSKQKSLVDYMNQHYKPGFTYQDFAPLFTAELFDPDEWADLFSRAGARYVILTAKTADGFTLWPSNYSWNWNSVDVGPHRDLVGELREAVRRKGGLRFGVEHSLKDTFHPLFKSDEASGFATAQFPPAKSIPELKELVERYQPDIIWSQGDQVASSTYWNSASFLAWLYNDSPVRSTAVVNDRWGEDVNGQHGDFIGCEPRCSEDGRSRFKFLQTLSIDRYSFGYRRVAKISDYHTVTEIIEILVHTISQNGNLLLGVSATKDGIIPQIFQERLLQLGTWLKVNGEAVYGSTPWKIAKDASNPDIWYTAKGSTVYVFVLKWPKNNLLHLESLKVSSEAHITVLGRETERLFKLSGGLIPGTVISLPTLTPDELPTPWAWVLKVEGVL